MASVDAKPETLSELLPHLFLPRSLAEAGDVAHVVTYFANAHYYQCFSAALCLFAVMQTFNIPGCIFLNVVMGCVFGYKEGMAVGVLSGTVGAMLAYLVSRTFLEGFVARVVSWTRMEERKEWFRKQVQDNDRTELVLFLMFLRISPMLPNWFINLVSPHVDVPFPHLLVATFFGIAPQTFLAVHAGVMLRELVETGTTTPIGPREWLLLLFLSGFALLPVLLKRLLKKDAKEKDE
eukprot:TRINITY_DN50707_c0_g1_i1.p1 TRINITY_DN50707_c0_g1~~TRINITY_DN50707_c0_g1_i1.p1  ORF type:complete len:261 (+),score=123.37 TRINITY_DN50707_c0_g1_i1:76-783(+)